MPRAAEPTRQRILDTAYTLFYRRGFARTGVDEIAAGAAVTKRTLYYHFDSKDTLVAAVLERHHAQALAAIRGWSERLPGGLNAMLDRLFADLAAWASMPRWAGAGFTRLVMELADLPGHPARAVARRHKAAVEAWLTAELVKRRAARPSERARQVMLLLEGSMALMLIHGDRRYAGAAAAAAKRLLAR